MKNKLALAAVALLGVVCPAQSATFTIIPRNEWGVASPYLQDMQDLNHAYFFTWGINFTLPADMHVESATLSFQNLSDWTPEADALYLHLLNDTPIGVRHVQDQNPNSNVNAPLDDDFTPLHPLNPQGPLIGTYEYPDNLWPAGQNVDISFSPALVAALDAYIHDGNGGGPTIGTAGHGTFGIGLDPDCHYSNDGVTLTITTFSTPDSGLTIMFLGFGVFALESLRRKMRM